MNSSWKKVVTVIASLLCVMIVCLAINVSVDKITGNILPLDRNETQQGGNNINVNNNMTQNNLIQQGGSSVVQDPSGDNNPTGTDQPAVNIQQGGVQQGGAQQGGQAQQQTPVQNAENPLGYSKSQLIAYYNNCLNRSYSQPKINATKTEQVDVSVQGIDIGNAGLNADDFANSIIKNNTKKNGVVQTKSFTSPTASDGTHITQFVLPANLYDAAVKTISVSKSGNGYKIVYTLNPESCAHDGVAKYNASCAWPLDINVIDFGAAVKINSCTFNYPGTTITATIDSQGRVTNTVVEMPLTVANAQAKALGINITVGAIQGKWTCKNTMSF